MKVYNHYSYGNGTVFVSPGAHHPETADWVDPKTKVPIMFTVKFKNGIAEVDDNMGRYLVKQKLAQASPVILPAEDFAAQSMQIERLAQENMALKARLESHGIAA